MPGVRHAGYLGNAPDSAEARRHAESVRLTGKRSACHTTRAEYQCAQDTDPQPRGSFFRALSDLRGAEPGPMPLDEAEALMWEDFLTALADMEVAQGMSRETAARYYHDPAGFARDCIAWPIGKGLTPYQDEILAAIPVRKRVSVRGPHGLGKPRRAQSRSYGLRSPGTRPGGTGNASPRPARGGSLRSTCGPRSKSGRGSSSGTSSAVSRWTSAPNCSP